MTTDPLADTGLTEDGFVAPREDEFVRYIRNQYERATGESPDWEETEYLGASTAAVAEVCAEMAQQVQDLYEARDPRQASGVHLEAIALLTGIDRRPATRGLALVALVGEPGTVVPAGKEVRGGGPQGRLHWQIPEDVVIGSVFEFSGVTAGATYTVTAGGDSVDVTAESGDDVDRLIRRLAEAAEGLGAVTEANAVDTDQDGEADFLELRPDATNPANPDVKNSGGDDPIENAGSFALVESKRAGELLAPKGAIDEIATPVKGWTEVGHFTTIPGQDRESDEQLRARRQQSLAAAGASSPQSIRANLLQLPFVRSAIVEDNKEDTAQTVAGYQLEPHSFIAIIYPSDLTDDQKAELAETLWGVKPAGIPTQAPNGAATDSAEIHTDDGVVHTIKWAYASEIPVDVSVTVTLETGYERFEVEQPIRHEIEKYINSVGVGETVRRSRLFGRLDDIAGVDLVKDIQIDGTADDYMTGKAEVPVFNDAIVN